MPLYAGDSAEVEDPHSAHSEHFAEQCDDGPQLLAVLEGAGEVCGQELLNEGGRLIRSHIYPAYQSDLRGSSPVTLTEVPFAAALGPGWHPVAVTDLQSTALVLAESIRSAGARARYRMLEIEPSTGELRNEVRIDNPEVWSLAYAWWLPHPDAPVLVAGPDAALRYDPVQGAMIRFEVPEYRSDAYGTPLLWEEDLWISSTTGSLWRIPLAGGAWEEIGLPPGLSAGVMSQGLAPAVDGLLLTVSDQGASQTWRWSAGEWQGPMTAGSEGSWARLGLADGRLLGRWLAHQEGQAGEQGGLTIYDPEAELWRYADDPCGEDAIDWASEFLLIGSEPYLWQENLDGFAFVLTQVALDE